MNTSVNNINYHEFYNSSLRSVAKTNFRFNHVSNSNIKAIQLIKSFSSLNENWDSYGAAKPDSIAIIKAISFILWISDFNQDIYFTAPSPDGNILVELKHFEANLEFEFSSGPEDTITAFYNKEFVNEAYLNDTTKIAYIKWLICPDGKCLPSLG